MAQKHRMSRFWLAGVALAVLAGAAGAGWYSVHQHASEQNLQQEVLYIAAQLRVPTEQDTMTAATSPDTTAQHMRYEIQQDLLKGQNRKQIITEMVHEYGGQVLAAPEKKGFAGLVWTMPVAALIIGLTILSIYVVRSTPVPAEEAEETDLSTHSGSNGHEITASVNIDEDIDETLRDYL